MALAIDASSPAGVAGTGTTTSTASFTPPANSLIVALLSLGNPSGTTSPAATGTVTATGLTFTRKRRQNDATNGYGGVEIYIADAGGSATARTVNATSAMAGIRLQVVVVTGAASVSGQTGATMGVSTGGGTIFLTATAAGSYIFGVFSDIMSSHTLTAQANTTVLGTTQDATNLATFSAFRSTAVTATAGGITTGYTNNAGADLWELAAIEIIAGAAASTNAPAGVATGTGSALAATATTGTVATVTPTITNPLGVFVDWNGDGDFTDPPEDVTARVRGGISASYGREGSTSLSLTVAGRGAFDLDNTSRDYSARNASSPVYPNVIPARPVLITRTVGTTTYVIFRGHTDDQPLSPDLAAKRVTLNLVDYLADFRGVQVTTPLYAGIRTGQAIGYVLDAIGWTGTRDLDLGATTIPWFWAQASDAADLLQQILASEGPPSLITIDETGGFVFRDRLHRLIRSASTTSQATWAGLDSSSEPRMGTGFSYSDAWSNIVNTVSITVNERVASNALTAVWSTDETITIGASASYTVVIATSDPFLDAVPPVAGADYTLAAGSITSATLSRTSGASTSITLTAGGSGAQLQGLQLRAASVPVARSRVVEESDKLSQDRYGQRSLPSSGEPVWASYQDVQALADLYVAMRKDPLPVLSVRFNAQHTQTARLVGVLRRDLSDRVTVVEPETSLNDPFYVESISHNAASAVEHEVVFGCEAVPATPSGLFILGTSTLNSATPLGY